MNKDEVMKMVNAVYEHGARLYIETKDGEDETIYHICGFIQSYSTMMKHVPSFEDDRKQISQLEQIVGVLFRVFPKLFPHQRQGHFIALSTLLSTLYPKGSTLKNLPSQVVFQGLIFTCTNPTPKSSSSGQEIGMFEPMYKEYIPLWKNFLRPLSVCCSGMNESQYENMCTIIYDEFISSIILFVNKLDLGYWENSEIESVQNNSQTKSNQDTTTTSTTTTTTTTTSAATTTKITTIGNDESISTTENPDPAMRLKPNTPRDMELFLNMVEFCKILLPETNSHLFCRWVSIFGNTLIRQSTKYPMVSGFYHLLSVVFSLCDACDFFKGLPSSDADMDVEDEKTNCLSHFQKFIHEVASKMHQFKDELLGSCVQLLLSAPHQLLTPSIMKDALKHAFSLGFSYIPLAKSGISVFHHWLKVLPDECEEIEKDILPILSNFLIVSSTSSSKEEELSGLQSAFSKYKSKSKSKVDDKTIEDATKIVQHQVLRLLGSVGGKSRLILNKLPTSEEGIVWESNPRVKFHLPLGDIQPEIYLDSLLPRVLELSQRSSDRQIKIAACELLHSIILLMIGRAATNPQQRGKRESAYGSIYSHIFPEMIKLASDSELVTRQLFDPLMIQSIHWFTQSPGNPDGEIMLDSLMDSLGSFDGSLQTLSAKYIAEFLAWSIKQSSKDDQLTNPQNAKSLFKRLFNLARHPSPQRRIGCAMALKELLRPFREEDPLVDQFVLELASTVIHSIRLCHYDEPGLGSAEKMLGVLSGITTIIKKKFKLLLVPLTPPRREHPDLHHFIEFVFANLGRPETTLRNALFNLLETILPLTGESLPDWFNKKLISGPTSTISIFENIILSRTPNPQSSAKVFTFKNFIFYFIFNFLIFIGYYPLV